MHDLRNLIADYDKAYSEEPLSFEETEELAEEFDDAMCALGDEAYEDMKCGC